MILSGKETAKKILGTLEEERKEIQSPPGLAVILVGDNEASLAYIAQKKKSLLALGGHFELHHFSDSEVQSKIITCLDILNKREDIHGILVQAPLPSGWNYNEIIRHIDPKKDVDGFTSENISKLYLGETDGLLPCTPHGILRLLQENSIEISGKNIAIIGKSTIVGKPLSLLLTHQGATVTLCHSKTQDIASITRRADIIITAIGKPRFFTQDYFQKGSVIIDVGITRTPQGLLGDCCFEELEPNHIITPVPGGVGPMTVAMLLENIFLSAKRSQREKN